MTEARATDHQAVVDVLNRYAEALDARQWDLLDDVFHEDATADYGIGELVGRTAIVEMVRGMLGGCGPSQHLLGNHQVEVEGDRARAVCRCRVFHQGSDGAEHLTYEVLGHYRDELERTPSGWRIVRRRMTVSVHLGDPSILGPSPSG